MATMGRPREFDVDDALDRAMEVFWRNGYEGASVAELCQAMGIRPPSLYAAFGNKAGLFRHAIDRYLEQKTRYVAEAFEAPSAREMVERLVRGCADFLAEKGKPAGCLFMRSASAWGDGAGLRLAGAGGAPRRGRGAAAGSAWSAQPPRESSRRASIPASSPSMSPQCSRACRPARPPARARAELRQIGEMALRAWPE